MRFLSGLKTGGVQMISMIVRFIVSAIVLMLVGYITPGFSAMGFTTALIAAIVIAGLAYVTEMLLGKNVSPFGRGGVGFIISAAVIFLAQYVVPGMQVSIIGALIAAFLIGVVDAFIPTMLR
jgi:putative membrane protein